MDGLEDIEPYEPPPGETREYVLESRWEVLTFQVSRNESRQGDAVRDQPFVFVEIEGSEGAMVIGRFPPGKYLSHVPVSHQVFFDGTTQVAFWVDTDSPVLVRVLASKIDNERIETLKPRDLELNFTPALAQKHEFTIGWEDLALRLDGFTVGEVAVLRPSGIREARWPDDPWTETSSIGQWSAKNDSEVVVGNVTVTIYSIPSWAES